MPDDTGSVRYLYVTVITYAHPATSHGLNDWTSLRDILDLLVLRNMPKTYTPKYILINGDCLSGTRLFRYPNRLKCHDREPSWRTNQQPDQDTGVYLRRTGSAEDNSR